MNSKDINDINGLFNRYNLTKEEQATFWNLVMPIYTHDEFQRRMNAKEFPHHDTTSLGNHILSDAVVTYALAKKAKEKGKTIRADVAVLTAMFHDLYERPWQNAGIPKKMFVNKHGFIHPLESCINAATWYPDVFKEEDQAKVIIDGIVHHMWPWPVRAIDSDIEVLQLNNTQKFHSLPSCIKNLIIYASNIGYIKPLHISLHQSTFLEGRIMSKADKIISFSKDSSIDGIMACFTGKNAKLDNYKGRKK